MDKVFFARKLPSYMLFCALALTAMLTASPTAHAAPIKSVVLVHGAFVDGSGWKGVYQILEKDGYDVTVVQNPTASLEGDVSVTEHAIDSQKGDVLLVGHSYGGAVITEAGNDSKVRGLVYVAAFAPDDGESVGQLSSKPAMDAPKPPILPPQDGFLVLDRSRFRAAFAADLSSSTANFMAASQTPWGIVATTTEVSHPAWKVKPAWYIVAQQDKMISPSLERWMATRAHAHLTELAANHAVYVSKPQAVAAIIEKAAREISHSS